MVVDYCLPLPFVDESFDSTERLGVDRTECTVDGSMETKTFTETTNWIYAVSHHNCGMADKTVHESELDRASVAESLRSLADEFESGEDVHVRVGNKSVRLQPPETVSYEVSVRETSSLIRTSRETGTVTLDRKRR